MLECLPVCLFVHHVHAGAHRGEEGLSDPMELCWGRFSAKAAGASNYQTMPPAHLRGSDPRPNATFQVWVEDLVPGGWVLRQISESWVLE